MMACQILYNQKRLAQVLSYVQSIITMMRIKYRLLHFLTFHSSHKTHAKWDRKLQKIITHFKRQLGPVSYTASFAAKINNKFRTKETKRKVKFGIKVPATVEEALELDREHRDTLWRDVIAREMSNSRMVFEVLDIDDQSPIGNTEIIYHLIFDVKMDLSRKARNIAGVHLTDPPSIMTYASVVGRETVRRAFLVAAENLGWGYTTERIFECIYKGMYFLEQVTNGRQIKENHSNYQGSLWLEVISPDVTESFSRYHRK